MSGADVLSSRKKIRKTLGGWEPPPSCTSEGDIVHLCEFNIRYLTDELRVVDERTTDVPSYSTLLTCEQYGRTSAYIQIRVLLNVDFFF